MKTIFFLRHQAGGILAEWPFLSPPTEAQRKPIEDLMTRRYGSQHPKTKEPYWTKVESVSVIVGEIPRVEAPAGPSGVAITTPVARGAGFVKPPTR